MEIGIPAYAFLLGFMALAVLLVLDSAARAVYGDLKDWRHEKKKKKQKGPKGRA